MIADSYAAQLRDARYIGWVAYVDGVPIYENVPYFQASEKGGPDMVQPMSGSLLLPNRQISRNCLQWEMLPHEKIQRLELWFGWDHTPPHKQPVIRLDRMGPELRFIQYKRGAIVVDAGYAVESFGGGQSRTGVQSYVMGYWDPVPNITEIIEVKAQRPFTGESPITRQAVRGHPCWPRPHGFGLGPQVVQLTSEDVPTLPMIEAVNA
jgi:hypothetical protein